MSRKIRRTICMEELESRLLQIGFRVGVDGTVHEDCRGGISMEFPLGGFTNESEAIASLLKHWAIEKCAFNELATLAFTSREVPYEISGQNVRWAEVVFRNSKAIVPFSGSQYNAINMCWELGLNPGGEVAVREIDIGGIDRDQVLKSLPKYFAE
jgi:hypothetical protein